MTVDRDVRDPNGRPASAIRLTALGSHGQPRRDELYYDPRTSEPLAHRSTGADTLEGEPLYTETMSTVYEERAIVPSIEDRP